MVIVCGSATTWMVNKLVNHCGGLYGRVTCEIKLSAFTLRECEAFFKAKKVKLSRYEITCVYMMLGGIPYYLNYNYEGEEPVTMHQCHVLFEFWRVAF